MNRQSYNLGFYKHFRPEKRYIYYLASVFRIRFWSRITPGTFIGLVIGDASCLLFGCQIVDLMPEREQKE